jgi:DNA-directed RNA polymerase specialized sigma24 family protein
LEAPFREALLLVAGQGMTYKEAAALMDEPVGTVKWRVHEATKRMRELWAASDKSEASEEDNGSRASEAPAAAPRRR